MRSGDFLDPSFVYDTQVPDNQLIAVNGYVGVNGDRWKTIFGGNAAGEDAVLAAAAVAAVDCPSSCCGILRMWAPMPLPDGILALVEDQQRNGHTQQPHKSSA